MNYRIAWALVVVVMATLTQSGCRTGAGSKVSQVLDSPPPQLAGSEGSKGWYESPVHGMTD